MTPDDIKFRRCGVKGCDYKELRGSKHGAFWAGDFVCDDCFADLALAEQEAGADRQRKALGL